MYNIINKIYYRRPRGPKSAGLVAIATFATVVNPALVKVQQWVGLIYEIMNVNSWMVLKSNHCY